MRSTKSLRFSNILYSIVLQERRAGFIPKIGISQKSVLDQKSIPGLMYLFSPLGIKKFQVGKKSFVTILYTDIIVSRRLKISHLATNENQLINNLESRY